MHTEMEPDLADNSTGVKMLGENKMLPANESSCFTYK